MEDSTIKPIIRREVQAIIFDEKEKELLLVTKSPIGKIGRIGEHSWRLLKGSVQKNDSDEKGALEREIQEEIGLLPYQIQILENVYDYKFSHSEPVRVEHFVSVYPVKVNKSDTEDIIINYVRYKSKELSGAYWYPSDRAVRELFMDNEKMAVIKFLEKYNFKS